MKIAYILYGSFSSLDFASIYDPISRVQKMKLPFDTVWDLCAFNEHIYNDQGWLFPPTRVNKSLEGYDLAILPGCQEIEKLVKKQDFLDWLGKLRQVPIIASVGKGSLLLAAAGLMDGIEVASAQELLKEYEPYNARPVIKPIKHDGGHISAAGSSSALELGLLICEEIAGEAAVKQLRKELGMINYEYAPLSKPQVKLPEERAHVRTASVTRKTKETEIHAGLNLDGTGLHRINTGIPFFDHMLSQIAVHGLFDIDLDADGDLEIDPHHTIEDIGLALGQAFNDALGNRAGIQRMASFNCPMDESLASVVVDFSGRPYTHVRFNPTAPVIGGIPSTLYTHFFESFAFEAKCNLHIEVPYGKDGHHQVEAMFKATGRSLDIATRIDPRRADIIPSSKGVIS